MFTVRVLLDDKYVCYKYDNAHDAYKNFKTLDKYYTYVDCFIGYCRILWSAGYEDCEPLAD